MAHDPDLFNRWEAGQQYAVALLLRMIADPARPAERPFLDALGALLDDWSLDAAFVAEALALPSEAYLGDRMAVVRSEEHTSELQSLMRISYAVFCLKKKHKTYRYETTTRTYNQQ